MSLDYILSIIDFAIKISIIVSTAFFENETIDVVRDSTSLMNVLKDFFSVCNFEEYRFFVNTCSDLSQFLILQLAKF